MRGHIPSIIREELINKVRNRHHYLKIAMRHLRLNQVSDMHTFCQLAEREQKDIDGFSFFELDKIINNHPINLYKERLKNE